MTEFLPKINGLCRKSVWNNKGCKQGWGSLKGGAEPDLARISLFFADTVAADWMEIRVTPEKKTS